MNPWTKGSFVPMLLPPAAELAALRLLHNSYPQGAFKANIVQSLPATRASTSRGKRPPYSNCFCSMDYYFQLFFWASSAQGKQDNTENLWTGKHVRRRSRIAYNISPTFWKYLFCKCIVFQIKRFKNDSPFIKDYFCLSFSLYKDIQNIPRN